MPEKRIPGTILLFLAYDRDGGVIGSHWNAFPDVPDAEEISRYVSDNFTRIVPAPFDRAAVAHVDSHVVGDMVHSRSAVNG